MGSLAAVGLVLAAAVQAGSDPRFLDLSLDNDGERALRCILVMAHFMSDDLGTITPGGRLSIALERDSSDGSLFVRSDDGRRKMIENILCGARDDWAQTRGEVPLLPLRSSSATRALITCRLGQGLSCVMAEPEN